MPSEEVIELSVEETNKLRAQLGLPPLRLNDDSKKEEQDKEVLEMSVDETNALREKLGLAPLRKTSKKEIVHAPAENEWEQKKRAERVERAKLQRQVEQGIQKFGDKSLGQDAADAKSWAQQMRSKKAKSETKKKQTKKAKVEKEYEEKDLEGLNVGHSLSELQEGSTTVLTLADSTLLKEDESSKKIMGLNEEDVQLENVDLADQQKQQEGLRAKRKMELGMGRAGGYAGFDDDEFEELGGTQAPSRFARSQGGPKEASKRRRGFQIGTMLEEQEEEQVSDLFAAEAGKVVSLAPARADVTASDFMTVEEEEELRSKKNKDAKFKKKKKKDKKKDKKKKRRKVESDDDEEEEPAAPQKGFLDELEETAVDTAATRKKRRRSDVDDAEAVDRKAEKVEPMDVDSMDNKSAEKRAKYDAIMKKGNERAMEAFKSKTKPAVADIDEEPDDAFLNAALAKARRMNRLKELSKSKETRGADAVVKAVQSTKSQQPDTVSSGTITFAVDETREFTRALRARAEQAERQQSKKKANNEEEETSNMPREKAGTAPVVSTVKAEEDADEDVDMNELAKEVKEEDDEVLEGTTATQKPIGRGLGGVLDMLKQTGDFSRKNAGKEELRGRAGDKRNYEDYEPLDLQNVVKIDERRATDKDKEFSKREIKLEYRDKHGRLLTRKEAFRDLSYQFHGYGSGKRKEEKKLQQIAREQAEARHAAQQAAEGGTLGALKKTQKATGKAFVVHKT